MEMPDYIYTVWTQKNGGIFDVNKIGALHCQPTATYHHSRIVEALKAENGELKAKLDKAKWQPIADYKWSFPVVIIDEKAPVMRRAVGYFVNGSWYVLNCNEDIGGSELIMWCPTHFRFLDDAPKQP